LAKCGRIFPEFPKVVEEKKKDKKPKAAPDSKLYEKNRTRKFSLK